MSLFRLLADEARVAGRLPERERYRRRGGLPVLAERHRHPGTVFTSNRLSLVTFQCLVQWLRGFVLIVVYRSAVVLASEILCLVLSLEAGPLVHPTDCQAVSFALVHLL